MNIVQKVKSRDITPGHSNYREVTIDAAGNGPIINFNGVHARNSGLPGFSPIKQTSSEYEKNQENKDAPKRSWWDKAKDWGHTTLDVAGMIPVVGVAADLVNAGWYGLEGDYLNAGLSGLAALPGIGQAATATKLAKKGVGLGKSIKKAAKANPLMTGVDITMGADLLQDTLAGEEGLVKKDLGFTLPHSGVSPWFGRNEEGMSGIHNPLTGGEMSAVFPKIGEWYGKGKNALDKWDKKDNIEGNKWEQFKGGISNLFDSDDDDKELGGDTPPPVVEVENDDKEKKTKKPNYLKYRDKMKKIQKDQGFNLKY